MSKVLVIELPDGTDLTETIKAMNAVQVANIERCRVFAAVREDAEAVLAVFDANKADPAGEPISDGVSWPELRAWLLEHDIDADNCYEIHVAWTVGSTGGSGPIRMEVDTWRVNDKGSRHVGEDGEPATEHRMVQMRHLPAVEVVRYREESD